VENVLVKVLAKQPNERHQTAGDFMKAFAAASGRAASTDPLRTAPPPAPPTVLPPARPAGPVTGRPIERPTSSQPVHTPTVPGAQPAQPKRGGVGTALLGGGIGMFVGGVLVVGLIIACCIGIFALSAASATPTPVPSPTPPPTATPPAFVFYDTFSDADSGWGTGTDAESSVEYADGEFFIKIFTDNYFVWSTPGKEDVANIYVEAVVRNVTGAPGTAFGVLCHHQTTDSFYYFAITSDGRYAIAKATEGQEDLFLTNNDQWAESEAIVKNAASYRIGGDCGKSRLTLYVDGREIDSVTDSTYIQGDVGLFAWTGDETNAEVRFDDLAVVALP